MHRLVAQCGGIIVLVLSQDKLGDVVYAELPEVGLELEVEGVFLPRFLQVFILKQSTQSFVSCTVCQPRKSVWLH